MSHGSRVKQRIAYFESLRGLAAMVIVFYHLGADSPLIENPLVDNAWMMLDFFFILSGCVITMAFQKQVTTPLGMGDFLYGRFLRVYPLHVLMLGVFIGLELIKLVGIVYFSMSAERAAFSDNNLVTLFHNLALTNVLILDELTWNKPSWSIAAEFWTYIIFAGLAFVFRHNRARFLALSALIAFSAFAFLATHDMSSYHGMARCLWGFFLGVLLAHAVDSGRLKLSTRMLNLAAIVTLTVLCTGPWSYRETYSVYFTSIFFFLLIALFASPEDAAIKRALSNRFLVRLGTLSFGIYMIHSAVWWVLGQCARLIAKFEPALLGHGVYGDVMENPAVANVLLLVGIPAIIGLAEWSYRTLELPVYNRRWNRPGWFALLDRDATGAQTQTQDRPK